MQKKLIALAIAGAFVAPVAMADTANVTVYGIAKVSTENTKATADTANTQKSQSRGFVQDRGSRLGFKGTESLGNGMTAIFQYEVAVDMDAAGGLGASRDTYAGLSNKMGTVMIGYISTPYKAINDKMNIFIDTLGANGGNLLGTGVMGTKTAAGVLTGAAAAHNGRFQAVAYASPNLNGFQFTGAWVPMGEGTTSALNANSTDQGRAYSANATYANGPLYVGLGYQTMKSIVSNVAGGGSDRGVTNRAVTLAGMYTWQTFTAGLQWEQIRDDNDAVAATLATQSDRNNWSLSAQYGFGNNVAKFEYTRAGSLAGVTNTGAKLWTLGLDHNLSKRTKVYALYSKLDNDAAAGYQFSGATANATNGAQISANWAAGGGAAGSDSSGFAVGMNHSF